MRCFLHLVKGKVALTDDIGVDAVDIGAAAAEILIALRDLRAADPDAENDWHGWSLEIVDCMGYVRGRISLDEPENMSTLQGHNG
ncbi:DUF6894 family protein [Microvirga guangxiensis]|uniref:DUF6894 domain-containing protein n=1 Tax=Microvirga guangxiensis TaxID=549386 RepID=A0A1G5LL30_9HYPH|nr:hypothetical protein [Microvirga guangxiensis]SCZ13562.1 hypothetical protein SAMN02927923_04461 [Microvirga guangxiensis]